MDFTNFNSSSFEQLIRALLVHVLGPGVRPFGNGPDGGREATFSGLVNYPFPQTNLWNGYGVIQAKFKEKLESTTHEQRWARDQLSGELKRWRDSKRRARRPEYFIFCINIELTSVASTGGHDTLERVIEEYRPTLGFKEFHIWDAVKIRTLLDAHPSVKQRFAMDLTPTEIIQRLSSSIGNGVSDPESILISHLCRSVVGDSVARTNESGRRVEELVSLASVLIDLPVAMESGTESNYEEDGEENASVGAIQHLLEISSLRLDPETLCENHGSADKGRPKDFRSVHNRYAVLGGPGSGKSTIGQFLALTHRAALLETVSPHRLDDSVVNCINEIKDTCTKNRFRWPAVPRFPIRVELNSFAKSLTETGGSGTATISEYVRRAISKDVVLSHEWLLGWLRTAPILLIFDGLDEVPSSSNRKEVLSAIQAILIDAKLAQADMLVLFSSRRDGYNNEFEDDNTLTLHLLQFSTKRALDCARRYIAKLHKNRDLQADHALITLAESAENPIFSKLMCSPLQVAFMVTVLSATGKPSESRWQLFSDYYRTIYERELQKAVRPFDRVLSERRQTIDLLHHRIGFVLQARGALSGGTNAEISIEEFRRLVLGYLEEDGLEGDALVHETTQIVGAAKERLVFLTSRSIDRLSFDVRSLQEYMAAHFLTTGDYVAVERRLASISTSAYWRNTFLFAVGRFFVSTDHRALRSMVTELCNSANLVDELTKRTWTGSFLASEVLASGVVGNVPKTKSPLAKLGLDSLNCSLSFPIAAEHLVDAYVAQLEHEYTTALALHLGQSNHFKSSAAWSFATHLYQRHACNWALELIKSNWPAEASAKLLTSSMLRDGIAAHADHDAYGASITDRDLAKFFLEQLIMVPLSTRRPLLVKINVDAGTPAWYGAYSEYLYINYARRACEVINHQMIPVGPRVDIFMLPSADFREQLKDLQRLALTEEAHPSWQCLGCFAGFLSAPSAIALADALESAYCLVGQSTLFESLSSLPWIVTMAWQYGLKNGVDPLATAVSAIRAGTLGDVELWEHLESDWSDTGVSIEHFLIGSPCGDVPLCMLVGRVYRGEVSKLTAEAMLELLPTIKNRGWSRAISVAGDYLLNSIGFEIIRDRGPEWISSECLPHAHLITANNLLFWNKDTIPSNKDEWIDLLDAIGKLDVRSYVSPHNIEHRIDFDYWINLAWSPGEEKIGIYRLIEPHLRAEDFSHTAFDLFNLLCTAKDPSLYLDKCCFLLCFNSLDTASENYLLEAVEVALEQQGTYAAGRLLDLLDSHLSKSHNYQLTADLLNLIFPYTDGHSQGLLDHLLIIADTAVRNRAVDLSELRLKELSLPATSEMM